jgi:co-chaperonin GroES (HSP10)
MDLTPGRVLAVMLKPETVTQGGIAIPEISQANHSYGVVVRVGVNPFTGDPAGSKRPLNWDEKGYPVYAKMPWKVGDMIWFGHYAGVQLLLSFGGMKNIEHAMLDAEEDIYAKINPQGGEGE